VSTFEIFAAIPSMGTMGAIEYVGKPGGRVVVVVVVVVDVVVVVVGAIVLDGGIVDVIVSSAALEALEHAIMSMLIPVIMSGGTEDRLTFCIFRPKLVCFTSSTLEE
jgi:hypothetical protein